MMNTKKTILVAVILLLVNTLILKAQDTSAIHFEQQLKWSEVLGKAKAEHKYIFVDCYATWCAPCKWMDANVYTKKEVGDAYNTNFISVRLQMDKTVRDDSITKSRYGLSEKLANNYHVNAFPTFLFFDPDGNPVHKTSGSLDVKHFIQLASDAQNPDKQYYSIIKNFRPGQLDTAEEKNLPLVFQYSDHELAGKIAADYLSRIPKPKLDNYDGGRLMATFPDNPQVMQITATFLRSLHKKEFIQHQDFINTLIDQPQVKAIVGQYVQSLSLKEIGRQYNLNFMERFSDVPQVQAVAQNYINRLSEKEILEFNNIYFTGNLTNNASDRGFKLFYQHPAVVDTAAKSKDWAQNNVQRVIYNSEIVSTLYASQKSGKTPDFEGLKNDISKKYNSDYAKKTILDAKVGWFGYLVHDKNDNHYWPQFIQAEIDRAQETNLSDFDINNFCYDDIFHHSDDAVTLNWAVNRIQKIVSNSPNDRSEHGYMDTYACLLYKTGKKTEAIQMEETAVEKAKVAKNGWDRSYTSKIAAMKKGGPIWEDKLFQ